MSASIVGPWLVILVAVAYELIVRTPVPTYSFPPPYAPWPPPSPPPGPPPARP